MPRKHLFPLVVLLAAAAVAGLLALTRTVDLGQASQASTASDPSIAVRLKRLDRFEASLRKQLAAAKAPAAATPTTVYRRATVAAPPPRHSDDEGEESEGRDD
jgi:hypothetical protein